MDKPASVVVDEAKRDIVAAINNTHLDFWLLEIILKDIYVQVSDAAKIELENDRKKYNASLAEEQD